MSFRRSHFFVLSGYLITDLLLQEWKQSGNISIKNFYIRRIHRLYPRLVVMLFSVTAYITLFQRSLLKNIKSTILSNLLYVYNWVEIAHHQSYFNNFRNKGENLRTQAFILKVIFILNTILCI